MNLFRFVSTLKIESISEWKGESKVSLKIVDVDSWVKISSKEVDHSFQSFTTIVVSKIDGIQGSIPSNNVLSLPCITYNLPKKKPLNYFTISRLSLTVKILFGKSGFLAISMINLSKNCI